MTRRIVVMGVAGCGKSSVGRAVAVRLGLPFVEGDDLHPPENIARMSRGEPLRDQDRWGWLDAVGAALRAPAGGAVASCSALRRVYRDRLRAAAGPIRFVHLAGPRELIAQRMAARERHFMPAGLLDSQFATLEPPDPDEGAVTVGVEDDVDAIADAISATFKERTT